MCLRSMHAQMRSMHAETAQLTAHYACINCALTAHAGIILGIVMGSLIFLSGCVRFEKIFFIIQNKIFIIQNYQRNFGNKTK